MARKPPPEILQGSQPEHARPQRLSSRETLFLKYILAPATAAIWLTAPVLALLGKAQPQDSSPLFLLFFLSFGLGAAYIIHRCFRGLKNVWLTGEDLLVSNGFRTERIPLRWATDWSWKHYVRPGEVVYAITFDRETPFGMSIDFLCPRRKCEDAAMRRLTTIIRWNERKRRRTLARQSRKG